MKKQAEWQVLHGNGAAAKEFDPDLGGDAFDDLGNADAFGYSRIAVSHLERLREAEKSAAFEKVVKAAAKKLVKKRQNYKDFVKGRLPTLCAMGVREVRNVRRKISKKGKAFALCRLRVHCAMKWVRSEQQVADCLTKELELSYAARVFTSNLCTLGPVSRAPSTRRRKLEDPSQHTMVTAEDDIPMMNLEALKATQRNQPMDTSMAITTGVMPWRPRGLGHGAMAAAILAGQVYKSGANAVVPWVNEDRQGQQNVKLTVIVMMVIFTMGICVGCCVQWAMRRLLRPEVVQLGRPMQGIRSPRPPAQPPTEAAEDAGSPMPKAAAKAAVRPRAKAKAESAPKATAQPIVPKAEAQPSQPDMSATVERIECPLCNAPMVFKRAMRGGFFYGCSDYPVCCGSRRP